MHLLFYRKFTTCSIHIQLRGKNAIYAQTEAGLQKSATIVALLYYLVRK